MPSWLPKRDGSTPILSTWELGLRVCPKCKHSFTDEPEIENGEPEFSEWEHFTWCKYCKEQFPSHMWMETIAMQSAKFLEQIKPQYVKEVKQ